MLQRRVASGFRTQSLKIVLINSTDTVTVSNRRKTRCVSALFLLCLKGCLSVPVKLAILIQVDQIADSSCSRGTNIDLAVQC